MKPKITTLANGVRVLVIPQPTAATATVLILVATGSLYESKAENGLSHFLEHLYFKGTDKLKTSREIMERFDRIGAIANAFTSTEYTGYYAKGSPKHVQTFITILNDIYQHSTFPVVEIEKEKGVVIEEINMYQDMPQQKVGEELMKLMFGDQPAGWPVIGSKETVRSFTRDDVIRYQQSQYYGANTVVVVSGDVDSVAIKKSVEDSFGSIKNALPVSKKKVRVEKKALKFNIVKKASDQAHIAIGFHSVPLGHADAVTASLLGTILGRGMSSRLFQILREEMGVAYYVGAGQEPSTGHGIFEISAGVDKNKTQIVLDRIASILTEIRKTFVSDAELSKAIEYSLGVARLGLESSDDIAGFFGVQLLLKGSYKTLAELAREYRAVTPKDIRRMAQKVFTATNTSIAIVGPFDTKDIKTDAFLAL